MIKYQQPWYNSVLQNHYDTHSNADTGVSSVRHAQANFTYMGYTMLLTNWIW